MNGFKKFILSEWEREKKFWRVNLGKLFKKEEKHLPSNSIKIPFADRESLQMAANFIHNEWGCEPNITGKYLEFMLPRHLSDEEVIFDIKYFLRKHLEV